MATEVFFRADPVRREAATIPAPLFNRCRLFLSRCEYDYIFVPIRSMQYLAVIDRDEIIFVDSQAYAVQDGEGGRMIMLTWRYDLSLHRDNLNEPVEIEVLYHRDQAFEVQKRIQLEFSRALDILERRQREKGCEYKGKRVVALPSR